MLFDTLIEAKAGKHIESQRVLFQEVIRLSPAQSQILEELKDEMESLGFEIGFLGDNSWTVNSSPANLKGINIKDMILDVIDSVNTGGHSISKRVAEHIALSSARAAAVQYGQHLTQEEMDSLVASLFRSKEPGYTPDGKKTMYTLTFEEINKMFS